MDSKISHDTCNGVVKLVIRYKKRNTQREGLDSSRSVPITSTNSPITTVVAPKGLANFCIRLFVKTGAPDELFAAEADIVNSWTSAE